MSSEPGRILLDVRPLQTADAGRGIGSYVRGLLGGLVEEGFGPRLSLLVDLDLDPPEVPRGEFTVHGVRRRYRGRGGALEDAAVLPGELAEIRPALFHATSLRLPRRAPCPVAVTVHDLIPWAFGGWRMWGERTRYAIPKRLLRRASAVIAVSSATARDAEVLGAVAPGRITVVHEGLEADFRPVAGAAGRVQARWGLRPPYLLFVGALDVRKDPRGLLRAWAAAAAAGADVPLVIAGDPGPQAPPSMGEARLLGLVSRAELVDLLGTATALLFTSRYEGFGLPVLEAMGCGCPVLAYRNSSIPEVAGEAAVLVTDGDAAGLGREAAALLADPARAAALREAGLARAAGFTWRRAARETIAVYSSLIGPT